MTRHTTKNRYQQVRLDFQKLASKKHEGVSVYSYEYIIKKLSKQHFYSERTIENILKE
jgi:hypothetical protein